ncbi:coagulation factor 5 8 type domain-containing protein, partial [Methylobacterium sp. WL7]
FIPSTDALSDDGYFLSGMFFDVKVQKLSQDLEQKESRHIITNYIHPLFNRLPAKFSEKPRDQLLIHIRSGDIFSTWVAPHYPQPPLAFYKLVISRLLAENRISSIKMVFENRLNPVIAALEAYISEIGIPLATQSGTLADDVAALANGRYLVFGLGTFGPGVCHLSKRVEQVFYFASGWPQHFRGIPTIGTIIEVLDVAGAYTKVGEWDNSPERRQLMLDYPLENLAFDDA